MIPAVWRICPEFNVERLRPYLRRPADLSCEPPPSLPVATPDGALEHEVQELLKFKMRYGLPLVLVRWADRDASGDTWEPLDNLTNCEEAISAFKLYPTPSSASTAGQGSGFAGPARACRLRRRGSSA
jgi:hypothetical protein